MQELSFYINGECLGVAFKDEWFLSPGLFPFVCLYDAGDMVKVVN